VSMATKNDPATGVKPAGMTLIVQTVVRFAIGIVFMFGWYIIVFGHLTPGGGFAGGTILACGYVLLTLAFGKDLSLRKMSDMAASIVDNTCALLFVLIPIVGIAFGYFFLNFPPHGRHFDLVSAGLIPLYNIIIGLKVTSSLFAIFIALSIFGRFVSKLVEEAEEEE
jgi:multisubunit Na+/H+ antiporter MnhB subunit